MRLTESSTQVRHGQWHPGQDMTGRYEVDWRKCFKNLSRHLSFTLTGAVVAIFTLRFVAVGFDPAKTFEHVSPTAFVLMLLGAPVFSIIVALLIASLMRLARITIADGSIQGLNYWGRRKKIPLNAITGLAPFSNNGIRATMVTSRHHGQIYISEDTHHVPELLQFLNATVAENEKLTGGHWAKS